VYRFLGTVGTLGTLISVPKMTTTNSEKFSETKIKS
jgi:hypothetical protein